MKTRPHSPIEKISIENYYWALHGHKAMLQRVILQEIEYPVMGEVWKKPHKDSNWNRTEDKSGYGYSNFNIEPLIEWTINEVYDIMALRFPDFYETQFLIHAVCRLFYRLFLKSVCLSDP